MFMSHRTYPHSALTACVFLCLALSSTAFAADKPDHTSWGHNITIGQNEKASELTCFGCDIRVRGQVAGDVTAFFGSVVIEDQAEVAGEVTVFGSDIRLGPTVKVAGDVTVLGGEIRRDPQATIEGDLTAIGGRGWIIPILLAPFVILGLLIAFVVWLIQRARRPAAPPVPA
jgi:cytoskeletal protein CcmA (bactofilin family)